MISLARNYVYSIIILLLTSFQHGYADQAYLLNPGDHIQISVWQEENMKADVLIQPDGYLSYPLIGNIEAKGKSTDDLAQIIKKKLSKYIPDAEVSVRLTASDGNNIFVTGEVVHPGTFVMKGPTNVLQAISLAGGLTPYAKKGDILVVRRSSEQSQTTIPFNYNEVVRGDNIDSNIMLHSGDTVVVP